MYSRVALLGNIARFTLNEPSEMLRRVARRLPGDLRRRLPSWGGLNVSTGIAYIRQTHAISTSVHLANYWTSSYAISPLRCDFEIHDADGEARYGGQREVPDDGILAIDCREVVRRLGTEALEGTLSIAMSHQRLMPGVSVRGIVEYRGPRFAATHNYLSSVARRKFRVAYGVSLPDHRTAVRSSLAIVNASNLRPTIPARPMVSLYDATGQCLTRPFVEIPALGVRTMGLRELFPETEAFLGRGPCGVRVVSSVPIGRPLLFEVDTSGSVICMTEAASDFSAPTDVLTAAGRRRLELGVTAPCVAVDSGGMRTSYGLFNNYGFDEPYSVGFMLFDSEGKVVAELEEVARLAPFGSAVVSLENILEQARPDLLGRFEGSGVFFFPGTRERRSYPIAFCVFTELRKGDWCARFTAGSDLFNPRKRFHGKPFSFRTRLFGPAKAGRHGSTLFCLINTSTHREYTVEARASLSLLTGDGRRVDGSLAIGPFGCRYFRVADVFAGGEEMLAQSDGRGWLRVRDTDVRLYGYVIGTESDGAISASGLYGG